MDHRVFAIVPSNNLDMSEVLYRVVSGYGHYRILEDGRGWHLHPTYATGWPKNIEDYPLGLYLYVDNVEAMANAVREPIVERSAPNEKPSGTYEFSVSDPSGLLVRIGGTIENRSTAAA